MELFRQCDADNLWGRISSCKQAVLFRRGDVVKMRDNYYLALGHVQFTMLLLWRLEMVSVGKTNYNAFLLPGEDGANDEYIMKETTDLTKFEIVPATPVCPLHYLLACKNVTPEKLGVVMLQVDKPTSVLKHAAKHCFYDLAMAQLVTICKEERIAHADHPTLVGILTEMINHFLKTKDGPPSDETINEILALRSMEQEDLLTDVMPEDIAEIMCDDSDLASFKDLQVNAMHALPSFALLICK